MLTNPARRRAHPPRQLASPARGVVSLGVVLVLFFVLALVAAYANRNLIIDQRIAANSHRAERAQAAADAGLAWALSMLNAGRVDDSCRPTVDTAQGDFRSRYLAYRAGDGTISIAQPAGVACVIEESKTGGVRTLTPRCVCPASGDPAIDSSVATAQPGATAFRIDFAPAAVAFPLSKARAQTQAVQARITGCGTAGAGADSCAVAASNAKVDGLMQPQVVFGLLPVLPRKPIAALTVAGNLTGLDATRSITLSNAQVSTGIALHTGTPMTDPRTLSPGSRFISAAGSASDGIVLSDGVLHKTLDASATGISTKLFDATFSMSKQVVQKMPGVVRLACPSGCAGDALRELVRAFPRRMIFITGDVTLDGDDGFAGTPRWGQADPDADAGPLLLVVDGKLTVTTAHPITGFIVAKDIVWQATGATAVMRGAVVAENFQVAGNRFTIVYDPDVLRAIDLRYGAFAQMPQSWVGGKS